MEDLLVYLDRILEVVMDSHILLAVVAEDNNLQLVVALESPHLVAVEEDIQEHYSPLEEELLPIAAELEGMEACHRRLAFDRADFDRSLDLKKEQRELTRGYT